MIEITGNEIAQLNDTDLRSLVGLLCEAELRSIGLPTAGVTWGGHQDAKDGGIDVRVELTTVLNEDNFVPRSKVGFQVKKPDMAPSAIVNEMRPKGKLRKVIKDLIDAKGAYIIVSSQGSTTDLALKSRVAAMKEALADQPNASNIKIDFYDRDRVAGWVRSHPALVLWVRDKIGQPIQGWKAYSNYAKSPRGLEEEYILDEHVRVYNSTNLRSEGLSALEGITEIRSILHTPLSSVRLVGLSGVGKTRLIQALFDERFGDKPLNPSQVFYCDISDSPIPDPFNFAERLISLNKPAILAIDNCPPELHSRLTSLSSPLKEYTNEQTSPTLNNESFTTFLCWNNLLKSSSSLKFDKFSPRETVLANATAIRALPPENFAIVRTSTSLICLNLEAIIFSINPLDAGSKRNTSVSSG